MTTTSIPLTRLHAPCYTAAIFNPRSFKKVVEAVAEKVLTIHYETPGGIHGVAGCGNSGLPLIGAVGALLDLPVLAVRKDEDRHDTNRSVNGLLTAGGRYVFVDDLVSSGETLRRVMDSIRRDCWKYFAAFEEMRLGGMVLYDHTTGMGDEDFRIMSNKLLFCMRNNEAVPVYGFSDARRRDWQK